MLLFFFFFFFFSFCFIIISRFPSSNSSNFAFSLSPRAAFSIFGYVNGIFIFSARLVNTVGRRRTHLKSARVCLYIATTLYFFSFFSSFSFSSHRRIRAFLSSPRSKFLLSLSRSTRICVSPSRSVLVNNSTLTQVCRKPHRPCAAAGNR